MYVLKFSQVEGSVVCEVKIPIATWRFRIYNTLRNMDEMKQTIKLQLKFNGRLTWTLVKNAVIPLTEFREIPGNIHRKSPPYKGVVNKLYKLISTTSYEEFSTYKVITWGDSNVLGRHLYHQVPWVKVWKTVLIVLNLQS